MLMAHVCVLSCGCVVKHRKNGELKKKRMIPTLAACIGVSIELLCGTREKLKQCLKFGSQRRSNAFGNRSQSNSEGTVTASTDLVKRVPETFWHYCI